MAKKIENETVETSVPTVKEDKSLKGFVAYSWAYNQIKLRQAYADVLNQSKINPNIKVTEEAVKENYLLRKGLLTSEQQVVITRKRPRNTSNVDKLQ